MKTRTVIVSLITLLVIMLAGCADLLRSRPTNVDPAEAKYIEVELQLKNSYQTMQRMAQGEKRARAAGASIGSVITKEDYDANLDRLDVFKKVLRESYDIVGPCLDVTKFSDKDLKGCLSRKQIALILIGLLSNYGEGRL